MFLPLATFSRAERSIPMAAGEAVTAILNEVSQREPKPMTSLNVDKEKAPNLHTKLLSEEGFSWVRDVLVRPAVAASFWLVSWRRRI